MRGQRKYVERHQYIADVVAPASEMHPLRQSQRRHLGLQLLEQRHAVAHQHQMRRRKAG
ncbi:hypothetical protein D3C72_1978390 [compost metagenome]